MDHEGLFWLHIRPGVAYGRTCSSASCASYTSALVWSRQCEPGRTVYNMGMRKDRPNEEICHSQIRCPACKQPFHPEVFYLISSTVLPK